MKSALARRFRAALVLAGGLAGLSAMAAEVTLTPASIATSPGASLVVDVRVSNLGSGNVLGGFDLDVGYNAALVSFSSIAFGPSLGSVASLEALTSVSTATPGVVDFSEVSLLTPAQLGAAQAGSFSIATLTFSGVASGIASFSLLGTSVLSDAFGRPLPIVQASAIPEPESVVLLGIGLGVLTFLRRRAKPLSA